MHRHDKHSDHSPSHRYEHRFARRGRDNGDMETGHPWHRGSGRGSGQGGGHGGLGRFFAHGDLRLVILNLIAEKPRHGYEIIKAIEEQVDGAYSPSPGVVYPTLTMLEELNYVTVTAGESGKKCHAITDQGRAFLDANRTTLAALLARMEEAGRARGDGPAPQIVRAMENLKLALRLRLGRGGLGVEMATRIAAVLDDAARQVEAL